MAYLPSAPQIMAWAIPECCCCFVVVDSAARKNFFVPPHGNFFSMLHCCCYNVWRNYFLIKDNDLLDVLCPSRLISYWTLIFVRQYLKYTCQILWFETFSITTTKIGVAFNGKIIQNKKILSSSEYRSIQMHFVYCHIILLTRLKPGDWSTPQH